MRGRRKSRRRVRVGSRVALLAVTAAAGASGVLAQAALAQGGPATEEYNFQYPDVGNQGGGNHGGSSAASSSSGSSQASAPISSGSSAPAPTGSGGASSSPPPSGASTPSGGQGGSESSDATQPQHGSDGSGIPAGGLSRFGPSSSAIEPSFPVERPNTLPAIAADVAGEGGVPMLLAGLAAVLGLALFLTYKRRRAQTTEVL